MRSLYVDFDGVLFDTVTYAFLQMKKMGVDLTDDDAITDYFTKANWQELINQGGVLNDSIKKCNLITDLEIKFSPEEEGIKNLINIGIKVIIIKYKI